MFVILLPSENDKFKIVQRIIWNSWNIYCLRYEHTFAYVYLWDVAYLCFQSYEESDLDKKQKECVSVPFPAWGPEIVFKARKVFVPYFKVPSCFIHTRRIKAQIKCLINHPLNTLMLEN